MRKIPVASHSFLSVYERCPKQAFHKYVVRDEPYVETEAIKWGNEVHKALELAINEAKPLPEGMAKFGKYLTALGDGCKAELSLGMTINGKPTGFRAADCFFKGKVDVLKTENDAGFILDWKTGKPREDKDELERHGLLVLANFPKIERMSGAYAWLKEDRIGKVYDLRKPAPKTFEHIQRLVNQMHQTEAAGAEWPANSNPLCGWCSVKTCKHNPARSNA